MRTVSPVTSTSSSEPRRKVGAEHRLDLGQLEAVRPEALPAVLGQIITGVIAAVLVEEVELDSLNVLLSPDGGEVSVVGDVADLEHLRLEAGAPTELVVRAWAYRA